MHAYSMGPGRPFFWDPKKEKESLNNSAKNRVTAAN